MRKSNSLRWLVVVAGAAILLAIAAACGSETVEVPGETVVVEKVVTETVEVPGETVVVEKEVIKTVEVPGETVTKEVVKTVEVPGETVVVEKEVVKTVEVPGETVTVEVVKTVEVPGETVVVEQEVVKTVEVPGQTVVVEKVVVKEVRAGYVRNVWGQLVEKPQYGGTIPYAIGWDSGGHADPYTARTFVPLPVLESLMTPDYTIPPEEFDFRTGRVSQAVLRGNLAESFEMPDPFTWVFKIRKGVYWHDKAPMNGRELDAFDVEYTWHRSFGLGSGYTEPGPQAGGDITIESVTATDKWTVVFKTRIYSTAQLFRTAYNGRVQPREVIEQYGGIQDWTQLVGTGPWELTDFVEGSSLTYTKNPNYWQDDERHPGMRLPYADEVRQFVVLDYATRMAALRTGKSVLMYEVVLDQVESLQRTNPELMLTSTPPRPIAITLKLDEPPFDDIRVRHAMQMALDLRTINETYYLGLAGITPFGTIGPGRPGYYVPFDEWPKETKDIFRYNPEGAMQLIEDAGYTKDADGFYLRTKYDITPSWGMDLDLNQILKAYWAEIGVDVELLILESGIAEKRYFDKTYEGMLYNENRANDRNPLDNLNFYTTGIRWGTGLGGDPVFDELMAKAQASIDEEEIRQFARQLDMITVEQSWSLFLPVTRGILFYQPWFKGFDGTAMYEGNYVQSDGGVSLAAYSWIDQELREALGH